MSYVKPAHFFKVYSGQAIDAIHTWLADLGLSSEQVDWLGWKLSRKSLPHLPFATLGQIVVKIITVEGKDYSTEIPVTSPIMYLGTGANDE